MELNTRVELILREYKTRVPPRNTYQAQINQRPETRFAKATTLSNGAGAKFQASTPT